MGPVARYLGPLVPQEALLWQDPVPAVDHPLIDAAGHRRAEGQDPGLRPFDLAAGRHGLGVGLDLPRQRQARRRQRRAHPPGTAEGLGGQRAGRTRQGPGRRWRRSRQDFNARADGRQEGLAGRPDRARRLRGGRGGRAEGRPDVKVPFTPGRTDASQEQTDAHSFAVLEPVADGFRNYLEAGLEGSRGRSCWWTRRNLLTLTAPEMTVLVGGLRALDANFGQLPARRLHQAARDADQRFLRQPARHGHEVAEVRRRRRRAEGRDRATGELQVDRHRRRSVFGSNSSCAPSRRSTPATTPRQRSCATSWPPGTR